MSKKHQNQDLDQDKENEDPNTQCDDSVESNFQCRRVRCTKTYDDDVSRSMHEKKCRGGKLLTKPKRYLCHNDFCKKKRKRL